MSRQSWRTLDNSPPGDPSQTVPPEVCGGPIEATFIRRDLAGLQPRLAGIGGIFSGAIVDISDLTRLIDIDAALASDDGLNYADAAKRHGVTTKTVQRLVALIRATGRETVLRESPETGKMSRHHYASGVMRLFCSDDDRPPNAGGAQRLVSHNEIVRLAASGMRTGEIASRMCCSPAVVSNVKRQAGMIGLRLARSHNPSMSMQIDVAVFERALSRLKGFVAAGKTTRSIARIVGVTPGTVSRWLSGDKMRPETAIKIIECTPE